MLTGEPGVTFDTKIAIRVFCSDADAHERSRKMCASDNRFGVRWQAERDTALDRPVNPLDCKGVILAYPKRRRRFALPAHSKSVAAPAGLVHFPNGRVFYSDMWRIRKDQSGIYFESPDVRRGVLLDERTLDYQVTCIGIVSALIKRECFAQVGVFDESLIRYSDLDLFIRLSDRYDFLHCKEPLVKSDGLSANHRALVLARQYLIEKYRDRLERSNHLKHQQLLLKRAKLRARFSPIRSSLSTAVQRVKHGAAAVRFI